MWKKIVNPKTGRKVNITSYIGKNILRKYIRQLNIQTSGSMFVSNYSCTQCGKDLSQETDQFLEDCDHYYSRDIAFENVLEEHQENCGDENFQENISNHMTTQYPTAPEPWSGSSMSYQTEPRSGSSSMSYPTHSENSWGRNSVSNSLSNHMTTQYPTAPEPWSGSSSMSYQTPTSENSWGRNSLSNMTAQYPEDDLQFNSMSGMTGQSPMEVETPPLQTHNEETQRLQEQRLANLDFDLNSGEKEDSLHFRDMRQTNISEIFLNLLDTNHQPQSTLSWNQEHFILMNSQKETVALIKSYKFVNGGLELEISENKERSNNKLYVIKGNLINKNTFVVTQNPRQVFKRSFIYTYPISKTHDNTPIQFIWNQILRRGTRTDLTITNRGNRHIANGENIYRHWNSIYQEFCRPNSLTLDKGIGYWVYSPDIVGIDNETEGMLRERKIENNHIINKIWLHLLENINSSYRLVFPVNIVLGEGRYHAVNCIIELEDNKCIFYYYDSHPELNGEYSIGSTIVSKFQQLFSQINYTFEWRGHLLETNITNVQFDDDNCQMWRLIFGWIVMANPLLPLDYIAKDYFMRVRNNPLSYLSNFISFIEQFN